MFRQIRKLQESVDPATEFLFEESHPMKNSDSLIFISSRGAKKCERESEVTIRLLNPRQR